MPNFEQITLKIDNPRLWIMNFSYVVPEKGVKSGSFTIISLSLIFNLLPPTSHVPGLAGSWEHQRDPDSSSNPDDVTRMCGLALRVMT